MKHLILILLFISCTPQDNQTHSIDLNLSNETNWIKADSILVLINNHRQTLNLNTITIDYKHASAYAVQHTNYMIALNRINHNNFYIREDALKQQGAIRVGENVAYGHKTADSLLKAWLSSDRHKKIIEGDYNKAGFGVIPNDKGIYFYTLILIRYEG